MKHFQTRTDAETHEAVEPYSGATRDILILCRDLAHRMEVADLRFAEIDSRQERHALTITLRR